MRSGPRVWSEGSWSEGAWSERDRPDAAAVRTVDEDERDVSGEGIDREGSGRHRAAVNHAQLCQVGGQHHGLEALGGRRTGPPPQLGGERRAQEGGVAETAAELFGDERDLHRGRPRRAVVGGGPQLAPARGLDGGVELGGALGVVELGHHVRAQPIDHLRRCIAHGNLFGRETDVHQPAAAAKVGAHSSRNVRRKTFPDGVRGMASTRTTRCTRL